MIRITSKKEGFRRCGIAHSKEPVEYPDDRFSKKELKALQTEPMLVVEDVESKGGSGMNVKEKVALVEKAETAEALDKLAQGEERKGVLDAIEKRRQELAAQ